MKVTWGTTDQRDIMQSIKKYDRYAEAQHYVYFVISAYTISDMGKVLCLNLPTG
jgi:hypothetical protein